MKRGVAALINWCAAVLFLISLPTGCARQAVTLTISGDEEMEGAKVFVNGQLVGSLAKSADTRPSFVMDFPKGTLTIEVTKEGYRSFRDVIAVASNTDTLHVYARLEPAAPPTDGGREAMPGEVPTPPVSKVPVCPD